MSWSCIDLANSLEHDVQGNPTEHLDDPKWIADFIARHALPAGSVRPGSRELREALVEFRGDLRPLLERVATSGGRVTEDELKPLRSRLDAVGWRRFVTLTPAGTVLGTRPDAAGIAAVVAEIAASAARLLGEIDPRRIKICSNHLCAWMFVDETKGNVRRWCNDASCGRLDRVRRFRRKEREEDAVAAKKHPGRH